MMGKSSFETVRKTVRQFLPLRKTVSQLSFMFFELLAPDSLASLNAAYFHREMSNSQRRGVLLIIPRRLQYPWLLWNWLPIPKKVLSALVHSDETGFMKDRFIGQNRRLIGLSQIVYSASILYTPNIYASVGQSLLFKIKRQGLYHDYGDSALVFGSLMLKFVQVPALSVDRGSPQKWWRGRFSLVCNSKNLL